ncbi:unnamed protein product [Bursaphelenchus okinawaensis]|uniref:Uncharacterized protein n=1 Tax=Bursaphelenchus okinawaensis TaxID=465554 RepID=A0A811JSH4_9BILA|nr:unnamed protein product [Bursaphelenchus okinawaensis]CAG9080535.1 unnamed protein product [Bursaphelenchus okinawaensis]
MSLPAMPNMPMPSMPMPNMPMPSMPMPSMSMPNTPMPPVMPLPFYYSMPYLPPFTVQYPPGGRMLHQPQPVQYPHPYIPYGYYPIPPPPRPTIEHLPIPNVVQPLPISDDPMQELRSWLDKVDFNSNEEQYTADIEVEEQNMKMVRLQQLATMVYLSELENIVDEELLSQEPTDPDELREYTDYKNNIEHYLELEDELDEEFERREFELSQDGSEEQ